MMERTEKTLLGKVLNAEIMAAMNTSIPHLLQTRSMVAVKLVKDGLLVDRTIVFNGVTVKGYELSEAGRMAYCAECDKPKQKRGKYAGRERATSTESPLFD